MKKDTPNTPNTPNIPPCKFCQIETVFLGENWDYDQFGYWSKPENICIKFIEADRHLNVYGRMLHCAHPEKCSHYIPRKITHDITDEEPDP